MPRCSDSLDQMGNRIKAELEQLRAALRAAGIDEKKLMEGKVNDNDVGGIDDSKEATKDDVKEVDVKKLLDSSPPPPPPPKKREQALPGDEYSPPTPSSSSTNGSFARSPHAAASPNSYGSQTIKGPSPLPSLIDINGSNGRNGNGNDFDDAFDARTRAMARSSLPPPPPSEPPPSDDSPPPSPPSSSPPSPRTTGISSRHAGSMSSELGDSIILVASPNALVDDSPPSSPELTSRRLANTNHINDYPLDTVHEGGRNSSSNGLGNGNDGSDDDGDDDDGTEMPLPLDIRPSSPSTVLAATAAAAQASALAKAQVIF
jgi:hypothetical protein